MMLHEPIHDPRNTTVDEVHLAVLDVEKKHAAVGR
jgi:hypothetical protein